MEGNETGQEEANKVMLENLSNILKKNRSKAKEILSFLFNNEIMSENKYEIRMSQAEQVRDFIERISRLKTTSTVSSE